MRRFFKPPLIALAIALSVFGAISSMQRAGWLKRWEIEVYDRMLVKRHDPVAPDPRITVIQITDPDIQKHNYPVRDSELARLLQIVLKAQPAAIGLDLYRDLPEPREGTEIHALEEVFRQADVLTTIYLPPDATGPGVPAAPSLKDFPDRTAFNSFPADTTNGQKEGCIRRAILAFDPTADQPFRPSLAMSLAVRYLSTLDNPVLASGLDWSPDGQTISLGRAVFHRFRPNDGGFVAANAFGFQTPLDYIGPTEFQRYTLEEALNGKIPDDKLRGKIILIGTISDSIKDTCITPLNTDAPGVELHAQAINQILRNVLDGAPLTHFLQGWQKHAWPFLWALLGAASGLALLRWPVAAPVALVGGAALLVLITWQAFQHLWWLPLVEPALNYGFAALGTVGLIHFWERRQRSELMHLFSRHVSEKVAKNIWQQRETFLEGKRPRPRELTATVLFTDFVGFSSASERIGDPAKLLDWLNEGMDHLAQCVEQHDGIINKYIGDAIMAIFGVPLPRTTEEEFAKDAVNSVRCALSMSATLEKLNARWKANGQEEIGMRIGAFTGPLVAGSMGSAERLEFTVIGDSVNTASRLESTGKEEIPPPPGSNCRILIGESTYKLLGGRFEAEYVGEIHLKGKANTVGVYRVVREIPASSASSPQPAPALINP